jgi:hypothetical protein
MHDLTLLAIPLKKPGANAGVYQLRKRDCHSGNFLKGPVDWNWLAAAARLPGRALHVAIAIAYQDGFEETGKVKLKPSVCAELGIERHSAYRALKQLEKAGLVKVVRKQGAAPIVTVRSPNVLGERDAA